MTIHCTSRPARATLRQTLSACGTVCRLSPARDGTRYLPAVHFSTAVLSAVACLCFGCGTSRLLSSASKTCDQATVTLAAATNTLQAATEAMRAIPVEARAVVIATTNMMQAVTLVASNTGEAVKHRVDVSSQHSEERQQWAREIWDTVRPYLVGAAALLAARYGLTANSIKGDLVKFRNRNQKPTGETKHA